jgi:hypothetical protein
VLRLYIDEDSMESALVLGLRRLEFDVLTAEEASNRGLSDEDQLAYAAGARRAIYSRNVADFRVFHGRWFEEGRMHSGIILLTEHRASVRRRLDAFVALAASRAGDSLTNDLVFLLNYPPR